MVRIFSVIVLLAALVLGFGVAQAATIVNGDFELGCDGAGTDTTPCATIPDWTLVSPTSFTNLVGLAFVPSGGVAGDLVHSGAFGVQFGDQLADGGGSILQTATTVPGNYTLSFWYRVFGCDSCIDGAPNFGAFDVSFGGPVVWSAPFTDFQSGTPWQLVTVSVTASGSSAALLFAGNNQFFDIGLDDVSLDPAGEVPEPATFVLAGIPLLALLALRKKAAR